MKIPTIARPRALRLLAVLVASTVALTLAACASSDEPTATEGAGSLLTDIATVEGGGTSPSDLTGPPDAIARTGDLEGALGRGSYCWTETAPGATGSAGICADSIGIITTAQVFVVEAGATIEVTGFGPFAPSGGTALAWAPTSDGDAVDTDLLAWPPEGDALTLSSEIGSGVVAFTADLEPGRYVVSLGLLFPEGDVQYGLVLDVE